MSFLDRPQLDDRIRAALRTGSVVLHGSLGYGKTSALRSALRDCGLPIARYDTAPWERGQFALPLIDAIGTVRPDFGRHTRALVESNASTETVATSLVADLAHLRTPLVIAIDDGGDIADDDFRAFLGMLSHAALAEVHFAIASRRELASAMRGPVERIEESDLRFARGEIARLLRTEDAETVRRVAEATGGWPAAVALTIAPETIPEITRVAIEPYAIYDRIEEARVRDFRSLGAFVDAGDGYVTLQPVVRAQLIASMRTRNDGSLDRAYLAAAREEESAQHFGAALFHFEAANDDGEILRFLHRNIAALAYSTDLDRIDTLLRRTGAANPNRALSAYVRALIAHRTGDDQVGELFVEAAEIAELENEASVERLALFRSAEFELARGRAIHPATIARISTNDDLQAALLEGWSNAIRGDFGAALHSVEPFDADRRSREGSSIEILRAYAETSLGSIERARRRMDTLIGELEASDRFILHVQGLTWYARLALLWGETAIALDYAHEAYRLADGFPAETESAALFAALAEASSHNGNADDAMRWASALRRFATSAWYAVDSARLAAIADQQTARALFIRGDVAGARALAESAATGAHVPAPARASLLADSAAYACIALDRASPEAIARAGKALTAAQPVDAVDGVALANATAMLDALGLASGTTAASATRPLGVYDALARARDGSIQLSTIAKALHSPTQDRQQTLANALAIFTERGPRFEALLLEALARALRVDPPMQKAQPLPEALTDRESQVLSLLVEGLTNREIAERLILGTRTIETHVERILAKLGVASRTRAIAAALRLGLATPNLVP